MGGTNPNRIQITPKWVRLLGVSHVSHVPRQYVIHAMHCGSRYVERIAAIGRVRHDALFYKESSQSDNFRSLLQQG